MLRSALNIPRLSLDNLYRQIQNSQSDLNGTTKLTYESICQARFSALVSMHVPSKGAFTRNFTHLFKKDRSRAVYFSQEAQIVVMKSYKEFKSQITARGTTVAHNSEYCIMSKKNLVQNCS